MSNLVRIHAGKKDPKVLSEMIGLVDKEKMQKMMSVGASHLNKGKITVSMDMVNSYLEKWAYSKYDQFVLFDHSLKITEEVDLTMSTEQMAFEINRLCQQYRQFALLLKLFRPEDYISNSFSEFAHGSKNKEEEYVRNLYKTIYLTKGRRLSTALSEIVQDEGYKVERELGDGTIVKARHTFDIELSKVMQTKTIKGSIYISIDPCDFLMMSTNQHNWKSCMAISPECTGYNNVVLSKMTDEGSLVAYKCSNEEVQYNLDGFTWDYVSMQVRYLLFMDKTNGAIGIDGGYGGANAKSKELQDKILKFLMNKITKYCEVEDNWTSCVGSYPTDKLSYNEGVRYGFVHKPTIDKLKRGVYYDIGVKELVCPNCGKIMRERGNFICCAK